MTLLQMEIVVIFYFIFYFVECCTRVAVSIIHLLWKEFLGYMKGRGETVYLNFAMK